MMGAFINKGNEAFRNVRAGEYIDKSGMISVVYPGITYDRQTKTHTCVTEKYV